MANGSPPTDVSAPAGGRSGPLGPRWAADVVLEDGGTVLVRPADLDDVAGIVDLLVGLSEESRTQRFLTAAAPDPDRMARRLADLGGPAHLALVAEQGGRVVGVAEAFVGPAGGDAEIAFAVADDHQGRGRATAFLERVVAVAHTLGLTRLVATTAARNGRMLATFRDAGFAETTSSHIGVVEVTIEIGAPTDPAQTDDRPTPDERAPARSVSGALRAFAVMSGAVVLFALAGVVAFVATAVALGRGDAPPVLAVEVLVAAALDALVLIPWTRRWGTGPGEVGASLPGDEYIADAGVRMTRAITIDAPPARVWPWLAQIGADRAGFYSYAWLENLAGCRLHNADRIHPEWQHRRVGERVLLHPMNGIPITRLDAPWSFAMGGWYFVLEARAHGRTRLLARTRVPRGLPSVAYALCVELPHFVMERKMLLELRRRAEERATAPVDVGRTGRRASPAPEEVTP